MTFPRSLNRPDATQLVNPFGLNQAILMGLTSGVPGVPAAIKRMEAALQEPYGIFAEFDFLVLDDLTRNGNRTLLVNRLNSLAEASQVQSFDNLFLFFSGHAACAPNYRLLLPERSLPQAQLSEERDWLGWDTLREWLAPIHARRVMIILDSCYANALHERETLQWVQQFDEHEPGQKILIAAGSEDEATWAAGETSFLTEAMVEALEGWGARTDRGVVTSEQLFGYLHRRVPELSYRKTGRRVTPYRMFWPERPAALMALTHPRERVELDDALKDAILERRCLVWAAEHLQERSTPSAFPPRLQWEGLERKVWLEYADFQREPGSSSMQLAGLGMSLLDSGVDSSLAQACSQEDIERWVPTPTNPAPTEKPPVLVRLSGAIGHPDYVYEWEDLNARFQLFHDWLVETRWWDTLLIMGFPLDEPIPRQWLEQLTRVFSNCWMIFPHGEEHDRAQQLRDLGIKLILMDDLEVLKHLERLSHIEVEVERTNQVRAPLPKSKSPEPIPYAPTHNPFPGLLPFRPEHRPAFFGRAGTSGQSGELLALREDVHLHRKVLLYGETGVGKTSLLRAGLLPVLQEVDGFRVLYSDAMDPLADLAQQIAQEPCFLEPPTSANVLERVGFLSASSGEPVVVCIDHLERALQGEHEQPFIERLERALLALEAAWPTGSWHILLTIRTASYLLLRDLVRLGDSPASQPFQHRELGWLSEDMARQAIVSPLPPSVTIEDALINRLLLDLRDVGPGEQALYHPARLQIVCHSVYQNALKQGAKRLDLSHYKDGNVELPAWIAQRWEHDVFASLSRAETQTAQDLLALLVNSHGIRRLLPWSTLRDRLSERHAAKHVDAALRALVDAAVVCRRELYGATHVEITHDLWVKPCLALRREASSLANEAFGYLQQHRERLLAVLPKKTTRDLASRVGLWEQIPAAQAGELRKLHEHSGQYYRKRWITQLGASLLIFLVLGLGAFFLLPPSMETVVNRQIEAFLQETSSQQSKFWFAVNSFKKPEVQAIAKLRLTRKLLESKGQEACKILRALYHTSSGNVAESVQTATGSKGVYLIHNLECPSDTQLQRIVLRGAVLRGAQLPRATLQGAELQSVDLQEAVLEQSKLRGANLTQADLQKARLQGTDLSRTVLEKAQLQHADLRDVSFQGARMLGAQLQGAWLSSTQLKELVQAGASLRGAVCLTGSEDITSEAGTARSCYRWHRGDRKQKRPELCPKTVEGPIVMFSRLSKDGTCPAFIRQQIALSSAFCPKAGHPACAEGRACQNEKAEACFRLGRRYESGQKVEVDLYTAALFYRKACKAGHVESCFALGSFYLYGRGVERHEKSAARLFEKVCSKGHGGGCAWLAYLLEKGWGTAQDGRRAQQLYHKACEQNIPRGCVGLGYFYEVGRVVRQDLERARLLYQKACDAKHGPGCFRAARLLARDKKKSQAVNALYKASYQHLQASCDRDQAESCAFLGLLYEQGWGRDKDREQARQLYNKACQLGHGLGCNSLGTLFFFGRSVKKSLPTALALYHKACERNNGEGCDNLGSMYERANGVKKDFKKARSFYLQSCRLGYGWGCNSLGDLYNLGRGVRRSRYRARRWYKRACKLGVSSACR